MLVHTQAGLGLAVDEPTLARNPKINMKKRVLGNNTQKKENPQPRIVGISITLVPYGHLQIPRQRFIDPHNIYC